MNRKFGVFQPRRKIKLKVDKSEMDYTLIMPNGTIMTFYVKSVAELYRSLNGGTLVCNDVLKLKGETYGYSVPNICV